MARNRTTTVPGWLGPETWIEEILEKIPGAAGVLRRHGIVCLACGQPVWGSLEENARRAGIEDLQAVLDDLARGLDGVTEGRTS